MSEPLKHVLDEALAMSLLKRQQAAERIQASTDETGKISLIDARAAAVDAGWSREELAALINAAAIATRQWASQKDGTRPRKPKQRISPSARTKSDSPPPGMSSTTAAASYLLAVSPEGLHEPEKPEPSFPSTPRELFDDASELPLSDVDALVSERSTPVPSLDVLASMSLKKRQDAPKSAVKGWTVLSRPPREVAAMLSCDPLPRLDASGALALNWGATQARAAHRVLGSATEEIWKMLYDRAQTIVSHTGPIQGTVDAFLRSSMSLFSKPEVVCCAAVQGMVCALSSEAARRCRGARVGDLVGDGARGVLGLGRGMEDVGVLRALDRWTDVWSPPIRDACGRRKLRWGELLSEDEHVDGALRRWARRWMRTIAWAWAGRGVVRSGGWEATVTPGWWTVEDPDVFLHNPQILFQLPLSPSPDLELWDGPHRQMQAQDMESSFEPIFAVILARLRLVFAKEYIQTWHDKPLHVQNPELANHIYVPLLPPLLAIGTNPDGSEWIANVSSCPTVALTRH